MIPLVLRPQPQADALASALQSAGYQPVVCPLLTITPGQDLPRLPELLAWAELIIATSAHAVYQAERLLSSQGVSWPHRPCLAVGSATASAWQECGIGARAPEDPRSEGLLRLPELAHVSGRRILILRGNGGRELLAERLRERGADIRHCECYQRHYPALPARSLFSEWRTAGVDSVIISSGELFSRLLQLAPPDQLEWLHSLLFIVPSPRVAALVQAGGCTRIHTAQGAGHPAVVAALRQEEN